LVSKLTNGGSATLSHVPAASKNILHFKTLLKQEFYEIIHKWINNDVIAIFSCSFITSPRPKHKCTLVTCAKLNNGTMTTGTIKFQCLIMVQTFHYFF